MSVMVIVSDNNVFINHLSEKELKRLVRELRRLGLKFEVKTVFCG